MSTIEITKKHPNGYIENFGALYCTPLDDTWDSHVEIDVGFTMRSDLTKEFARDLEKVIAKYAM